MRHEFITRIARGSTSPLLAKDIYSDVNLTSPFDFDGYTGKIMVYTEFVLDANETAEADNDSIVVYPPSEEVDYLSHLIKAGDTITIGSRTTEKLTVDSVTDSTFTIKCTVDLTNNYKRNEIVRVIWLEDTLDSSNFVVGDHSGTEKNRIQYRPSSDDMIRIYDKHKVLFRVKNAGGTIDEVIPDQSYVWYLEIYDDVDKTPLVGT